MEGNLFEYLLIIFFIVAALQNFLGKKKKQQRQREKQAEQEVHTTRERRVEKQESTKDILEQLFGLKIPDEDGSQKSRTPSDITEESYGYNDSSWNPEEEFKDVIVSAPPRTVKKEKFHTESEFINPTKALEKKIADARKSLQNLPDDIEVEDLSETTYASNFVISLKRKITNPETIREFILFSEILNKPKALRR